MSAPKASLSVMADTVIGLLKRVKDCDAVSNPLAAREWAAQATTALGMLRAVIDQRCTEERVERVR